MSAPDRVDQVKCIPAVPGLGENLDTVRWYGNERFAADVRCRVCGITVGCRVLKDGEMHSLDYNFWAWHFEGKHPEVLTKEAPAGKPGPKANDETDTEAYPKAPPVSSTKGQD
jgi:hypothetical protein